MASQERLTQKEHVERDHVLIMARTCFTCPVDHFQDPTPLGFQAEAVPTMGAAGGKLTGAGPGTGRKRVRIIHGLSLQRRGLTEEVAGAGESVDDSALGLARGGGDGVG